MRYTKEVIQIKYILRALPGFKEKPQDIPGAMEYLDNLHIVEQRSACTDRDFHPISFKVFQDCAQSFEKDCAIIRGYVLQNDFKIQ